MNEACADEWLAGVDGYPGGWIAAFVRPTGDDGALAVFPRIADVLAAPQNIRARENTARQLSSAS